MTVSHGLSVQRIESDVDGITIHTSVGKSVIIPTTALSGTRVEQAEQLIELLQELLDVRIRRSRLPQGDPDRAADPAMERAFWDGAFMVFREVVVDDAVWNEGLQRFDITLRLPAERR
jgi:hypothetical protein